MLYTLISIKIMSVYTRVYTSQQLPLMALASYDDTLCNYVVIYTCLLSDYQYVIIVMHFITGNIIAAVSQVITRSCLSN